MLRATQVFQMRTEDELTFREIGEALSISHVAAIKLFWNFLRDCHLHRQHNEGMVRLVRFNLALRRPYKAAAAIRTP